MFTTLPDRRGVRDAESMVPGLRKALWPGLDALSLGDRHRFHGREEETARLTERLCRATAGESPVVWLHGDSGVGKTSLVKAGLLPRWSSDAGAGLVWLHLIPEAEKGGRELIESIARGILREVIENEESSVDLAGRLRQFTLLIREDSSEAAAEYLSACFRRAAAPGAVGLLFIDQFGRGLDRLITGGDETIGTFLRFLRDLSLTGAFPLLIAMRSHQVPTVEEALKSAGLPRFGEWFSIDPLSPEKCRHFLESAPSERAFDGEMRISAELAESFQVQLARWPMSLPLISELLGCISLEDPDAEEIDQNMVDWYGGLGRIFAEAAERATESLDLSEGAKSASAFSRLMAALYPESGDLDERREIPFLEAIPKGDAEANELITSLINGRVLQIAGNSAQTAILSWTYGPGLAEWEPAKSWLNQRERIELRKSAFEDSRKRWEELHRTPVCLIHSTRALRDAKHLLERHLQWPCLSEPLIEYLEASVALDRHLRAKQRQNQKRLWMMVGGAAAVLVAIVTTLWLRF